MTVEAVRPDYGGAWVGGIVPAVLGGQPASWLPQVVADAEGVVLLVCDGLGWEMLGSHRARMPVLAAMQGGPITTIVPSTTSAGLTSIATGATPSEHGLVGYRIRVGGEPLNVLRWQLASGPDPRTTQPVAPFLGRDVPVVTRAEFRHTGFTEAHLRDTTLIGWRTPSTLVEHVRRLATDRHPLVYAYYDGIDKVAHEYGLRNEFLPAELAATDALIEALLDALPQTWALVVTADHGQVHVEHDGVIGLDAVDRLVAQYSGEGRFRTMYARPGRSGELVRACEETYGDTAWVFTRERLFDEGWLGSKAALDVPGRLGDVVLAAREPVIYMDPDMVQEATMRSHHGSLTPAEMHVPLLAARGRGA